MRRSLQRIGARLSMRIASRWRGAAGVALTLAAGAGVLLLGLADGAAGAGEAPPLARLSRLAGGPPERCAFAGPDSLVCGWRVQGSLLQGGAGQPTSASRRANLVCEVSLADDLDRHSACRVHAAGDAAPAGALPAVSARGGLATGAPEEALERLAEARTVAQISHFVGDVPQRCRTGAGDQECAWLLLPGGLGHERLARSQPTRAVALRCRLPLDGRPRATGSCTLDARLDETP